jgi:hypothetical protein
MRAVPERFEHVEAGANAAVEQHLDAIADRAGDVRKRPDRGARAIELAATVI